MQAPVRGAIAALLWAGPIGIALALALLLAGTPFFRTGPGVPSAGDARAWTVLWGALALAGGGCCVGLAANAAWLVRTLRRAHRPTGREWLRTALNATLGVAFLWIWFGG